MEIKSCCFIGHRVVEDRKIIEPLKEIILDLIENKQVKICYFGSRSEFNDICHEVVSELKKEYRDIKRIGVTCKSEAVVLAKDRVRMQKAFDAVLGVGEKEVQEFEDELRLERVQEAGRLSYIKRNEEMINASDYVVIYLNENYIRQKKNTSGTKLAYDYAKQKKKKIILV